MLEAYRQWVVRNAPLVSAAEGFLQGAVWLLPDRFSDSELKCEALNAGLGLLSLFNACVLDTADHSQGGGAPGGHPRGLPLLISAVQQVEVLLEIAADQWSSARPGHNKYDVLCGLELLKLVLRVKTLHDSGGRLLLDGSCSSSGYASGSAPENRKTNEDHNQVLLDAFKRFRAQMTAQGTTEQTNRPDCPREDPAAALLSEADRTDCQSNGGSLSAAADSCKPAEESLDGCEGHQELWWNSVLHRQAVVGNSHGTSTSHGTWTERHQCRGFTPAASQSKESAPLRNCLWQGWHPRAARELMVLGELLHLSRPMIYCLLLRRFGRRSWRPWLISLLLDLASSQCLSLCPKVSNPWSTERHRQQFSSPAYARSLRSVVWSSAELQERQRRRLALLVYLLRSPAFEGVTRPVLMKLQSMTSWLPLFGFITEKTVDILVGIQPYYTYTAAS